MHKIVKSNQQWQQVLTAQQFTVCRQHGAERAITGEYFGRQLRRRAKTLLF